jgi:hypothetical protein
MGISLRKRAFVCEIDEVPENKNRTWPNRVNRGHWRRAKLAQRAVEGLAQVEEPSACPQMLLPRRNPIRMDLCGLRHHEAVVAADQPMVIRCFGRRDQG